MRSQHRTVRFLIEHHAQIVQPFYGAGAFSYQFIEQFRHIFKVSAAKRVDIMDHRRIVFLVCRLNSALCHHGVGVAHGAAL